VAFFRHLCEVRGIQGFQAERTGGGNAGFLRYFKGLPAQSGAERLKGVVVASDNDDTPDASFKLIRDQLKKAKVPAPDNPLETVKWAACDFAVTVLMIPFVNGASQKGCLETLLLQSVTARFPAINQCADSYLDCAGVNGWANAGSIAKMRLRSILSAAWAEDPYLGLQWAMNPTKDLIPLQHRCFDEIAEFLRAFPGGIH